VGVEGLPAGCRRRPQQGSGAPGALLASGQRQLSRAGAQDLRGAADGNSTDEESSDDAGDSGGEEAEALAAAQARKAAAPGADRPAIYNTEALHSALEDISWPDAAAWEESLAVTGDDAEQARHPTLPYTSQRAACEDAHLRQPRATDACVHPPPSLPWRHAASLCCAAGGTAALWLMHARSLRGRWQTWTTTSPASWPSTTRRGAGGVGVAPPPPRGAL